jgi:hypothetical protein
MGGKPACNVTARRARGTGGLKPERGAGSAVATERSGAALDKNFNRLIRQPHGVPLLPEAENGHQSFIDAPLLLRTDPAYKLA